MFVCHSCSQVFYRRASPGGLIPGHMDALLGKPCAAINTPIMGVLDLDPWRAEPPQVDEPDSWGLRPRTNRPDWEKPRTPSRPARAA